MERNRVDSGRTIAAVSTAPGLGAVSLIRLSGPQAVEISDRAADGRVSRQRPRFSRHCRIIGKSGETLDDGLLTVFPAPHSYTGETCVEFTGHGGMVVTREVLARFLECGAVPAEPGEFTKRAFLNGRLDLSQAEGVMDVLSAQTSLALRAARAQLDGHLGRATTAARDELLATLAHLEAWIDFPDEDIDPETGGLLRARVSGVLETVNRLLATADQGKILREGVRTVIYGPPNAGKSSLLNRLSGYDRAIVSEIAGTTRDTIEETINFHGIPLRLVDTAGMRGEPGDVIEAEGISRTLRQIENAGLLLEVFDASQPRSEISVSNPEKIPKILILNKSDVCEHQHWAGVPAVRISCVSGAGFEDLPAEIRNTLHLGEADWGEQAIAINARHQAELARARTALVNSLALLASPELDPGIVAIDLREALDSLGAIAGRLDTEDLLGVIFSSFCIGK